MLSHRSQSRTTLLCDKHYEHDIEQLDFAKDVLRKSPSRRSKPRGGRTEISNPFRDGFREAVA